MRTRLNTLLAYHPNFKTEYVCAVVEIETAVDFYTIMASITKGTKIKITRFLLLKVYTFSKRKHVIFIFT